jgi:predicted nuclease of predicted toxin-antitoxin system
VKPTFFADQCVPEEISHSLETGGYRVIRLRSLLPIQSPDPVVMAKAQELDAILLSLNGDFSDIVAYPPGQFGGNVAIQLHNHPETIPYVTNSLLRFLAENPMREFYRGKLFLVEAHRIRVRA